MDEYIVYVRTDDKDRILEVNSSEFLQSTEGWTEIDRGNELRHLHAQGNYFGKPICDENGIPLYKLANGKARARTAKEIQKDAAALPAPTPSEADDIDALIVDHELRLTMLELGM